MRGHERLVTCLLLPLAVVAAEEQTGQGQVFWQSYHLGGWSGAPGTLTGLGVHARYVTDKAGTLTVHSEGYALSGSARLGNNSVQWELPQWRGRQWKLTAGDFDLSSSVLERPFYNVFYPNLLASGARIEATGRRITYQVFAGQGLAYDGPRIPLRLAVPQTILGGGIRTSLAKNLQIGLRVLHIRNSLGKLRDSPFERNALGLDRSTNATAQILYTPRESLKLFAEFTQSLPGYVQTPASPERTNSFVAGLTYQKPRATVRLNYVNQSRIDLPLLQTRTGDRRGPFAEASVRPLQGLELFASASMYESSSRNPDGQPAIRATSTSGGFHSRLPARFDLSGTITQVRATTNPYESRQRQMAIVLSRPIGRSTIRLWARELQLRDASLPSRQRSWEVENTYVWRNVVAGGALRLQQMNGMGTRTTAFGRGQLQVRLRTLTFYQNMEYGRDLANQTLFAANRFQTAAAGINWRPHRDWAVDAEIFRNRLVTTLNPLQEFVLNGAGVGTPVVLPGFRQWTVFARVSRSFGFGSALSATQANRIHRRDGEALLTGSIEGFVREAPGETATQGVAGIAVQLDEDRIVYTDRNGRYRFPDVADGTHAVRLAPRELPAEYDAASERELTVVRAGRASRLDLLVLPLSSMRGHVATEAGDPVAGAIVRLRPGETATQTADNGDFQFYNLRQGEYEVSVDPRSLPPRHTLLETEPLRRAIRPGWEAEPAQFRIRVEAQRSKPIRIVIPGKQ